MHVAEDLRENGACNGRGNLTAVEVAARRIVEDDEHDDFGIIDGREAAERRDVVAVHVARAVRTNLLRRTRLAADAVALDLRLLAAARRDDLLQKPDERLRRRRLQHAAHLIALRLQVERAVGVVDLLDDVRLQEDAVVGDRRHRRRELQGRHGDALADRHRRHVRIAHVFRLEEDAALLCRQLDARRLAEAEELRVLREPFRAEIEPDEREARVQRVLDDIGERHRAEALAVPVLYAPARDHDVAGIDEDLVRRDELFFERRAGHDGLKRRARLVDRGDGDVLPRLTRILGEIVRVVGRAHGEREDAARLWIHDDRRRVLRRVRRHRAVELLLHDELDAAVDRQRHRLAAIARVAVLPEERAQDRAAAHVGQDEVFLLDALDDAVELLLNAVEPLVVRADEAEDVRREHVVRIVALRLLAKAEAVAVRLLADEILHGIRHLRLHAPLDPDEAAALRDVLKDVLLAESHERREVGGERVGVPHMARIDEERLRHRRDGELPAVRIEDRTARRLRHALLARLHAHALRHLRALDDLHPAIAAKRQKEDAEHEEHGDLHVVTHAPPALLHALRFVFHVQAENPLSFWFLPIIA